MRKSSCKQKKFCHYHESNRCKQLCLSTYSDGFRCTSTIQRHVRVRNYLNIVLDVKIVYTSEYSRNYKTQASGPPSGHDLSPAAAVQKLAVPTCVPQYLT
eukprot:6783627-Ditylum_brightwellii.AAC.1